MKGVIDKNVWVSAVVLGVFGVVGATGVALTHWLTEARIEQAYVAERLKQINEILPKDRYDNDLLRDVIIVPAGKLCEKVDVTVYRARRQGKDVAAIFETTAPNGYSGPIRLLVGVNSDGSIAGVRVLEHNETPGLGDRIELRKSPWVLGFNGKSLGDPPLARWAVKRDGGDFDQFTGATISPRAVTQAVRNALLYFAQHRDEVFAPVADKASPAIEKHKY